MAKNMRKIIVTITTLALLIGLMSVSALAAPGKDKDKDVGSGTEYVAITLNGGAENIVDSSTSHTWLTNGSFSDVTATVVDSKTMVITVQTSNGLQTYTGKLSEGYEFTTTGEVDSGYGDGQYDYGTYDRVVVDVSVKATAPTAPADPTEPTEPSDPADSTEPAGPSIEFTPGDTTGDDTTPDNTTSDDTTPDDTTPDDTTPDDTTGDDNGEPLPEPGSNLPTAPRDDPEVDINNDNGDPLPEPGSNLPTAPRDDPEVEIEVLPGNDTPSDETPEEPVDPPYVPEYEFPVIPPVVDEPVVDVEEPTVEIEEPEVPLVEEPEIEEPMEEIPDEEVPLAEVPYTGSLSILWIALSCLSAAALVVTGAKRKQ